MMMSATFSSFKGKWLCSIRAGIWMLFGTNKALSTSPSDWSIICAQLIFDKEMKIQFPVEGSALCHLPLSQVVPSLSRQSWAAKGSRVPGMAAKWPQSSANLASSY